MTTTKAELAEISLRNLREHRDDMARWLAVEVLLADPVALEDDTLQERLIALQDRLEELTRVRYGVATATVELDPGPRSEHPWPLMPSASCAAHGGPAPVKLGREAQTPRGRECRNRSRRCRTVNTMSAQPTDNTEPYEVIHLGGEAAAIVPLADLRRLCAVERNAPAEVREDAEIEAALAVHDEWVHAGRPGARSHDDVMAELLGQ